MADDEAERPVEFDAWIAGRSAALTRFAYLLTGSEVAAERGLTSALTIACATWSRVRRSDDPEAQVQRLVVEAHLSRGGLLRRERAGFAVPAAPPTRDPQDSDDVARAWHVCAALPAEQRAALVLRCYAEMTYPQIAGAMGGKESVAQAHVERSFEALRVAIGRRRNDDEIETAFRDAFIEHAEDPSDPGDRAPLAHAGAGRRRRRQLLSAAVVTAVLVGGLGGAAISYDGGNPVAAQKLQPGDHPGSWRAESYNGIQLWVPASWGWGQVPRLTSHGLVSCGLNAFSPTAAMTGARYVSSGGASMPYVGRPAEPDAGCGAPPISTCPHVWFDSPLKLGTGPIQTTVRVTGITQFNITVADRDRAERAMILASIQRVVFDAHGCPRDAAGIKRVQVFAGSEPLPRFVRSLSFCLFVPGPANQQILFYSTRVEGADAQQATAQLEAAPQRRSKPVCLVTPAPKQVVVIARTPGAPSVFGVNPGTCPAPFGYVTGSGFHILTEASLRLWAIDGLSLYASSGLVDDQLSPFVPTR